MKKEIFNMGTRSNNMVGESFRTGRRRTLAVPLMLLPIGALAERMRVSETEQQAQALGYKHDASHVDKAKFKNYQPDQTCANCNLFKGKAGDSWGPCDIFGGREVNSKGWCAAWVKKA
jgi:hypothetical protein